VIVIIYGWPRINEMIQIEKFIDWKILVSLVLRPTRLYQNLLIYFKVIFYYFRKAIRSWILCDRGQRQFMWSLWEFILSQIGSEIGLFFPHECMTSIAARNLIWEIDGSANKDTLQSKWSALKTEQSMTTTFLQGIWWKSQSLLIVSIFSVSLKSLLQSAIKIHNDVDSHVKICIQKNITQITFQIPFSYSFNTTKEGLLRIRNN
jgi:hypothetical protein